MILMKAFNEHSGGLKFTITKPPFKPFAFLIIFLLSLHLSLTIGRFLFFQNPYYRLQTTKTSPSVKATSTVSPISKFVTILSQVGEYHLTLEGYTSPGALVELTTGLFTLTEKRTADENGYFRFNNILLHPFLSKEPCLMATDRNGLTTAPLCLPALPSSRDVFITGVILAPTLFLEKSRVESGKNTLAYGFTTPNSLVNLYLFREEKKWFLTNFIKAAQAKGAPIFSFKSNKSGYFEFNLPSYLPTTYRLFVASKFLDSPSPKSNTLKFQILSFWQKIIISIYNLLYLLWLILKKLFTNSLFLFLWEIAVIILLLFLLRKKKKPLTLIKYHQDLLKKDKNKGF